MGRLQRVQITQESSPPRLMSYVGSPPPEVRSDSVISATENLVTIHMANTDNLRYEMGLVSSWHPGRVDRIKCLLKPPQFFTVGHCSCDKTQTIP